MADDHGVPSYVRLLVIVTWGDLRQPYLVFSSLLISDEPLSLFIFIFIL